MSCEDIILPDIRINLYLFSRLIKKIKNKFRLLVIDDNQEMLAGLKRYLSGKQFAAVKATEGLDALLNIERDQEGFDLVITDVDIPDVGGIGIVSLIKQRDPNISTPSPEWVHSLNFRRNKLMQMPYRQSLSISMNLLRV